MSHKATELVEVTPEMGAVGKAIDDICARFPDWKPSEAQIGFALAVAKHAIEIVNTRSPANPEQVEEIMLRHSYYEGGQGVYSAQQVREMLIAALGVSPR